MLVLLVLAAVFYLERTTFLDNAFQTVQMIQQGTIVPMADRFCAMLVRLLPLAVIKAGGSLKLVLFSFSISYILFHVIVYVGVSRFFNQDRLALLIPAFLVVGVPHSFFWCNSELIQAASVVVLLIALLRSELKSIAKNIGLVVLIIACLFFHPLSLVLITFALWYEMASSRAFKSILPLWLLLLVLHFLKSAFMPNWYDTMKSKALYGNFEKYGFEFWQIPSLQEFVFDWTSNWIVFFLIGLTLGLHMWKRKYFETVVILGSFLFFLYLVHLSDVTGEYEFYIETNRMPLIWMSLFSIVTIAKEMNVKWLDYLLFFFISIGIVQVVLTANHYQERISYIEGLVKSAEIKSYARNDSIDSKLLSQPWGMADESLILSTLKGQSKTIFITVDPSRLDTLESYQYQSCFEVYDSLDNRYFYLQDSNYQPLEY